MGDYTNKLQLSMPSEGGCNWAYDWYRNQFIIDAVAEQELNDNSVSSGCILTDGTGGLSIDISAGIVVVDDVQYDIAAGNHVLVGATVEIEQYNFIYVDDSGTLIVSTLEPSGSFALIGVVDTSTTGVERIADLRRESKNPPVVENDCINGSFDIWQRGDSWATVFDLYTADRFFARKVDSTVGVNRVALSVGDISERPDLRYSCNCDVQAIGGTGAHSTLLTRLLDVRKYSGKTVCISFWAKSPDSRTIEITVDQVFDSANADVPLRVETVNLTTGWIKYTVFASLANVAGKTIGDLSYTSFNFVYESGPDYTLAPGASYTTGEMEITGIEIYQSDKELPVRQRTPQEELRLCLPYCEKGSSYWSGLSSATSININTISFVCKKIKTDGILDTAYTALSNITGLTTSSIDVYGFHTYPSAVDTPNALGRYRVDWIYSGDL